MNEIKKHYVWVDYAKFLSIFLVVYFHTPPKLDGIYGTLLGLIRMPCFYFLSGFLFRFEKYPSFFKFAKHRSKQLLIPYFCFFGLFYAYWLITGHNDDPDAPLYQPLLEYLYGRPSLVCTPMWFISCLFILQCLFYGLHKLLNRRLYIIGFSLITPFIPVFIDLSNSPWMLDNVCRALPFYSMASLFSKEISLFIEKKKKKILYLIGLIVFFSIVFMIQDINNDYVRAFLRIIGSFCILFPLLFGVKYLSEFLGKIRSIEYIATNSIIVLALHTYLIHLFLVINTKLMLFEMNYSIKLLMALVVVALLIIPIYLINKYTPFIVGKKYPLTIQN